MKASISMFFAVLLLVVTMALSALFASAWSATPAPVKPAEKKVYSKTVVTDSVRVAVTESLLVVRHDTIKVAVTLRDTVKAVRSDTTHGVRVDTLKLGRKK